MKFRITPDRSNGFGYLVYTAFGSYLVYCLTLWGAKRYCRKLAKQAGQARRKFLEDKRQDIIYEVNDDSTG